MIVAAELRRDADHFSPAESDLRTVVPATATD